MAQTVTTTVSTGATTVTLGTPLVLNPVAKSTTIIWSATAGSSAYALVEMSLDDPTLIPLGGPALTWAPLSSATLSSSVVAAAPLTYTVLSPIGAVRINSTTGSTSATVATFTLKALQSVTA